MTSYKISQLTAKTAPAAADLLVIVDSEDTSTPPAGSAGSDKNTTVADLASVLVGTGKLSAFLCAPVTYAPASRTVCNVTGTTMAAFTPPATTVASGSNGGEISTIASWSSPSAGVLDVASAASFPSSGTITVAASGATTAIVTYTGTAAGQLTGCAYVSGSASGTVSTGGAVTLTSSVAFTGPFTAPASGSVTVTCSCVSAMTAAAFANVALAAHGTVTPLVSNVITWDDQSSLNGRPTSFVFLVTGLTPGTSYNFDLVGASGTSADAVDILAIASTSTTGAAANQAPILMTVQAV